MPSRPPSPPLTLSGKAGRTGEQPISRLIGLAVANPRLVNFAAGLVDPQTLPTEETARIGQKVLLDPAQGQAALQYDDTAGLKALRIELVQHLERLEGPSAGSMNLSADDLIITTGSQQMLYLLAEALLDEGDIVLAANPSYFVYAGALASFKARVIAVPMDENGMDVDAVEQQLAELHRQGLLNRVKFIYCTSYYQNPTGLTLSLERRQQLYDVVRRQPASHRILILEDAAYRELRYDGPTLPSIKQFDPDNRWTILTQTFSKPFAPGIRVGYTALPADLRDAVLNHKGCHDFGSANLCQHVALEAMHDGTYCAQVQRLCAHYRQKRDLMLQALDDSMPRDYGITWTRPHGGLYVWVTLPQSLDTRQDGLLFSQCVNDGVLYVPGDLCFYPDGRGGIPRHHLRLSFGAVPTERIRDGVRILCEAVAGQLSGRRIGVASGLPVSS